MLHCFPTNVRTGCVLRSWHLPILFCARFMPWIDTTTRDVFLVKIDYMRIHWGSVRWEHFGAGGPSKNPKPQRETPEDVGRRVLCHISNIPCMCGWLLLVVCARSRETYKSALPIEMHSKPEINYGIAGGPCERNAKCTSVLKTFRNSRRRLSSVSIRVCRADFSERPTWIRCFL